jgi:cell division control protein 6
MKGLDVASYLSEEKQRLERQFKQVKDFRVFEFHHVPEQPLMRDECRAIINELMRFDMSGVPTHLAIIGGRGSGKTLTIEHLRRIMSQHAGLEFLYANCRNYNTSFKILAHLLGVKARGASMAELFERFNAAHGGKTVVVLDEVDLMSPKDRRREILYLLSRSKLPHMVIMLSNSPHVMKELDAATRSSLQPVPLHFRNYNAQQLHAILRDRAQRGLHRWDDGALGEIAALTTRLTNSDARLAIKTLQYSVTNRGGDLRSCFERARRDLVIDMISDLSDSTLTILWAAATNREDFAKAIYRRYCRLSQRRREKPFSYVYFYSNLSYLQSAGLVALVSTKQGRTYANRVLLTFDPATVNEICQLRFES